MSERDKSTLNLVYDRWLAIQRHLTHQTCYNCFGSSIWDFLAKRFLERLHKQILPIHRVAHYLHPENHDKRLPTLNQMELLAFLKQHTSGQYHADIETEIFDFWKQENQMLPSNNAWNNTNDPLLFWRKVTSVSPHLGKIARRIWSVAANSVPLEQAFSTMNFLYSKLPIALLQRGQTGCSTSTSTEGRFGG